MIKNIYRKIVSEKQRIALHYALYKIEADCYGVTDMNVAVAASHPAVFSLTVILDYARISNVRIAFLSNGHEFFACTSKTRYSKAGYSQCAYSISHR